MTSDVKEPLFFTLFNDLLVVKEAQVQFHPNVAPLYGDDMQQFLNSINPMQLDISPVIIPPGSIANAFCAAVNQLLTRWNNQIWPFGQYRYRYNPSGFGLRTTISMRNVSKRLNLDPAAMSRSANGSLCIALPKLMRLLRWGGYRLAISKCNEPALSVWLSSHTSHSKARRPKVIETPGGHRIYDYSEESLEMALIVPETDYNLAFYNAMEQRYLVELQSLANPLKFVSRTYWHRVKKQERFLSLEKLAEIAEGSHINFFFLPIVIPVPPSDWHPNTL